MLYFAVVSKFGDLPNDLHAARRYRKICGKRICAFAVFKYIVSTVRRKDRLHCMLIHHVYAAGPDRYGDDNAVGADRQIASDRQIAFGSVVYEALVIKRHSAHVVSTSADLKRYFFGIQRFMVYCAVHVRANIIVPRRSRRFVRPDDAVCRPLKSVDIRLCSVVGCKPVLRCVFNGNAARRLAPVRDFQIFHRERAEYGMFRRGGFYRPYKRKGIRVAVVPAIIVICRFRERNVYFITARIRFGYFGYFVQSGIFRFRTIHLRHFRRSVVCNVSRRECIRRKLLSSHHISVADGRCRIVSSCQRDRNRVGSGLDIGRYMRTVVMRPVVCRTRVSEYEVWQYVFRKRVAVDNTVNVPFFDACRTYFRVNFAEHDIIGHTDFVDSDRRGSHRKNAFDCFDDLKIDECFIISIRKSDYVLTRIHGFSVLNRKIDSVPAVFKREISYIERTRYYGIIRSRDGSKQCRLTVINRIPITDNDCHMHFVDIIDLRSALCRTECIIAVIVCRRKTGNDKGVSFLPVICEIDFFQRECDPSAIYRFIFGNHGRALILAVECKVFLLRPAHVFDLKRSYNYVRANSRACGTVFKHIVRTCRAESDGDGLSAVGNMRRAAAVLRGYRNAVQSLGKSARISRILQ